MTKLKNGENTKIPQEFEMEQWIALNSISDVVEAENKYRLGRVYSRTYKFNIRKKGEFKFTLATEIQEDNENDESWDDKLVVHYPTGQIEGIYRSMKEYERRIESLLYFMHANWNTYQGIPFQIGDYSFGMQIELPDGKSYKALSEDEVFISGDAPYILGMQWVDDRGNRTNVTVPRLSVSYFELTKIRVTSANYNQLQA